MMPYSDPAPLRGVRAEQAWELLANFVKPGPYADLPVVDAMRTYLARDVRSSVDFPPFDRSVVDGFAVRSADLAGAPRVLAKRGLVRAGDADPPTVESGTCVRINTGAPLPPGADAVVMVENARELDDDRVELNEQPRAELNVERRGSILRTGEVLVPAGTRVHAGTLAALVSAGIQTVSVRRRPTVALFTTGDELAPAGATLPVGGIYDSNSVMLEEMIRVSGAELTLRDRCPDDRAALATALRRAMEHDLICVVGGMSKGTHDLIPSVLESLGVRWLVESMNLKPGKPLRIGQTPAGGWVLGLPGNPVSCAVCFLLFGRQIIHQRAGAPPHTYSYLNAHVTVKMPANGARPMFQPGAWHVNERGRPTVTPVGWRGSGDPFGLARATALIYRPDQAAAVDVGDIVPILILSEG